MEDVSHTVSKTRPPSLLTASTGKICGKNSVHLGKYQISQHSEFSLET